MPAWRVKPLLTQTDTLLNICYIMFAAYVILSLMYSIFRIEKTYVLIQYKS